MKRVLSVKEKTAFRTMGSMKSTYRRGFSRGLALGLILLAVLIVLTGSLLYGQGSGDALFIDADGNVGIGKAPDPGVALDVKGAMRAQDLDVKGDTNLGDALTINGATTLKNNLTVTGNVGIGTTAPKAVLHVHQEKREGIPAGSEKVLYVTGDFGPASGVEFRHTDQSQGIGFGSNTIYATGDRKDQNLNLKPQESGKVNIQGDLSVTGSTNGERPFMKFRVGDPKEQKKWLSKEIDIETLCGDEDGCRIRLLMQHEINDQVRTITEEIYIEQSHISNNKEPGLRGYTWQSGGGDYNWILGWSGHLYDLFNPFGWIWARNYKDERVYGKKGPAYTGKEKYKICFVSHPHITTTLIIYDR